MSSTKSVFVLSDSITATQIISFQQPLASSISKGEVRLRLESHSKQPGFLENVVESENLDVLIMSRYTSAEGKAVAKIARDKEIPVVFHLDDDLLNVPMSLGAKKFASYNDPKRLLNLRENMEAADLLYASTPTLAAVLQSYNLDVPIIGGSLYCSVGLEQISAPAPSTMPTIGYMGTGGHSADLALILPAIESLMDDLPLLRFETFGSISPPPSLARFGDRYMHHQPFSNYVEFRQRLNSLGWWIGLAPLEETSFNLCKADTKWVEYSAAGMATIASDLPVYHKACSGDAGVLAVSLDDWKNALLRLICDARTRKKYVVNAQNKLQRDYRHEDLERQLEKVFAIAQANAGQREAGSNKASVRI